MQGLGSKPVATTTAAISSIVESARVAVVPSIDWTLPLVRVMRPERTKSLYQSLTARWGGSDLSASEGWRSLEKTAWSVPREF